MIKVLFIAADSESAVVYGNTTKNTVIEYLSNLTPKNGEEAISIIMLIILLTTSKYVVARGMYADGPVYKALDRSNTKIQVNMNK